MSKHVQCALAALGACVLGGLVVAIVTVAEWLAPTTPALALLGAALLPAVLAGLMMAAPSDKEVWNRQLVLIGVIPGLVLGLITVALGAQWTQPALRAAAASMLSPGFQEGKPLLRGLDDPSGQVAVAACTQLAVPHFGEHRLAALERLAHRPQVALACLGAPGATAGADDTLSLARTWHLRLHESFEDEGTACMLSEGLGAVEVDRASQTARLMRCALLSDDLYAPGCCAQTLNTRYPTAAALESELKGHQGTLAFLGLGPRLLGASFLDRHKIGPMSLKTKGFQHLGLMAACETLAQSPGHVLSSFYQLTDDLTCTTGGKEPPTSAESWTHICQSVTRNLLSQPDLAPRDVFCSAVVDEEERQVEQQARRERERIRNPELGRLSSSIVVGHGKVSAEQAEDPRADFAEFLGQGRAETNPIGDRERAIGKEWQKMIEDYQRLDDLEPPDKDRPMEDDSFAESVEHLFQQAGTAGASRRQRQQFEQLGEFLVEGDFVPEP